MSSDPQKKRFRPKIICKKGSYTCARMQGVNDMDLIRHGEKNSMKCHITAKRLTEVYTVEIKRSDSFIIPPDVNRRQYVTI